VRRGAKVFLVLFRKTKERLSSKKIIKKPKKWETKMHDYATPFVQDRESQTLEQRRNTAIRGAFITQCIDLFDIYVPVVILGPILFYFQPAQLAPQTLAILSSLIIVTTLLGRPVGGLLFGIISDRLGRRKAAIYSVSGFAVITLLIATLPGYETIGAASYWLLIGLRFVDGICLGGGYTGTVPLALEYSLKEQRGLVGGLMQAAFPVAYVSINLLAMGLYFVFPLHGAGSPYTEWGWRIPFVIGAALAACMAYYYTYKVSESQVWEAKAKSSRKDLPVARLMTGPNIRKLLQVMLLMTGFWTTQNINAIFVATTLLPHFLNLPKYEVTTVLLIAFSVSFFSVTGSGMLSQKIGRRKFFMIAGPLIATAGAGILYFLATSTGLSLPEIIVAQCCFAIIVGSPWGVLTSYIVERFATDVRATGFAIGYSFSVVIPSFFAFYLNWMSAYMPFRVTPGAGNQG
jgi:MFS family permease